LSKRKKEPAKKENAKVVTIKKPVCKKLENVIDEYKTELTGEQSISTPKSCPSFSW